MSPVQTPNLRGSKKMEEALRAVAQERSGAIGEAFFQHLVEHLAATLQADYVFIGELKPAPSEPVANGSGAPDNKHPITETLPTIRTLAVFPHQKIPQHF